MRHPARPHDRASSPQLDAFATTQRDAFGEPLPEPQGDITRFMDALHTPGAVVRFDELSPPDDYDTAPLRYAPEPADRDEVTP